MNVEINSFGNDKVLAVRIVREVTGWGLKEAKDFVDSVNLGNRETLENVSIEIVEQLRKNGAYLREITDNDNTFLDEINSEVSEEAICNENEDNKKKNEDINLSSSMAESRGKRYTPIVASNVVSNLDREKTLQVLVEVGKIAKESEEYELEIASLVKRKNEESSKAEEFRKKVSNGAQTAIWMVTIVAFLIGLLGGPLCIVTGVGALIIMNLTVKKSDLKKHEVENNQFADGYIAKYVTPLQERLDEVYALRDELINLGKRDWAIDVVGKDLFYSACIQDLYNLIKNRRADNLKEALNKYDDSEHKARMEQMQAAIQNASEITARESVKQTAYSQEIAKNSHKAATAARQTAYNTRQIDRNTRRFR